MARRILLAALLLAACGQSSADSADAAPARRPAYAQTALFAGGCFWSAERDIEAVPGVIGAVSGFAGGRVANPSYDEVVRGGTGHVEAVQVTFDPARISYGQLARRFLRTIDPTDAGGQFCDRGENYHTAIFALNPAQRREAEAARAEANGILRGRVTTPVRGPAAFYPAEAYHQDYARRNPDHYNAYRRGCGKDARLRAVWGAQAATH
jgi:peptide-methionine (S)-S-oxide reductase